MSDKKLMDIKKVVEIEESENANKYLEKGWVLLDTYHYAPYTGEYDNLRLVYVLGKTDTSEDIDASISLGWD